MIGVSQKFIVRRWIGMLLILSLYSWQNSVSAQEELPAIVTLFGDSITVGYNCRPNIGANFCDDKNNNYVPTTHLRQLFATEPARSVLVGNLGDGGTTSSFGASQIDTKLGQVNSTFPGTRARYNLIIYGTNDFGQMPSISASTTGFNTGVMISKSRQHGYTPIIGTLTPRSPDPNNIPAYNSAIRGAASGAGAAVVDHYTNFINHPGGWTTLIPIEQSQFSGNSIYLHPVTAGYQKIANAWFNEQLKNLIPPIPDLKPPVVAPIIYLLMDDE